MSKIDTLKPKVKAMAKELIDACNKLGYKVIITEGLRTHERQNELYAQGRTKFPGEIVTNAKAGESFHNYGVAFDVCPVVNGKAAWDRDDIFQIIGDIGMNLGLEWGGSWKGSWDKPHFEYSYGYSIKDFLNGNIDWNKFEISTNTTTHETRNTEDRKNFIINRSLSRNMIGQDVKFLQQVLNMNESTKVATSGHGSPGKETTFFGLLTEGAVKEFQKINSIVSSGNQYTTGYGVVGPRTRKKLKEFFQLK